MDRIVISPAYEVRGDSIVPAKNGALFLEDGVPCGADEFVSLICSEMLMLGYTLSTNHQPIESHVDVTMGRETYSGVIQPQALPGFEVSFMRADLGVLIGLEGAAMVTYIPNYDGPIPHGGDIYTQAGPDLILHRGPDYDDAVSVRMIGEIDVTITMLDEE